MTPTLHGRLYDLAPDIYYGAPALAQTRLKSMRQVNRGTVTYVPARFKHLLDNPPDETKAMLLGRAFHHMLFTPADPEWWLVQPEGLDGRTTEGKKWKADASGKGLTVFTTKDFDKRDGMCKAAWAHEDTRRILEAGRFEVSLFGERAVTIEDRKDRLKLKSRLDIEDTSNAVITDFKSTNNATEEAFLWEVFDRAYHCQGAFYGDLYKYLTGVRVEAFRLVAIETAPPHNLKVFELSKRMVDLGREEYQRMLYLYMECKRNNEWPGYPVGVKTLEFPESIYNRLLAA